MTQHQTGWRFRIYPNGEFSGGYVSDRRFDHRSETDPNAFRYGNLWWFNDPSLRRWLEERISTGQEEPLDLSIPSNYHKRRGLNGITSRGSRLVRNTAYLLQKKYGRKRLSFLTLTVPPLGDDGERKVCDSWSDIVRLFGQWLKRSLRERGLPESYVGVTEIQEKRWRNRGEVGLHLHIVFVGRKTVGDGWSFSPGDFRGRWCQLLSHVVGYSVRSSSVENLQMVKKSASGYLGKYMSKGVMIVGEIAEAKGEEYIPKAWYTCSIGLKRAFAKSTRMIWDDEVNIMARLPLLSCSGVFSRVYVHTIKLSGRDTLMGIGGQIDRDKARKLAPELYKIASEPGKHAQEYMHMW